MAKVCEINSRIADYSTAVSNDGSLDYFFADVSDPLPSTDELIAKIRTCQQHVFNESAVN